MIVSVKPLHYNVAVVVHRQFYHHTSLFKESNSDVLKEPQASKVLTKAFVKANPVSEVARHWLEQEVCLMRWAGDLKLEGMLALGLA